MAEPANRVVQHLGGRERLVAALVGHDPQTGSEETLDDSVEGPQTGASGS